MPNKTAKCTANSYNSPDSGISIAAAKLNTKKNRHMVMPFVLNSISITLL